jgi:hypothetical protein
MNNDEFPILSEIDSDGNILPIGLNELDRLIKEAMSKPKKNWIAFYVRFTSEDYPLNQELHGWECQGATPIEAIEDLEKSPSSPHRIFLVDVVPAEKAQAWVEEAEAEAKSEDAQFSYTLHRRATQ